ncbi:MAG: TetR/AcrR family transcriptional regulator [Pseudomonadota bacterium]
MARDTAQKREALRTRLIDIAESRIAEGGLETLKARDLAKEAGISVGAIYNVFGDIRELVLAVNGRTFKRIGETVGAASHARSPSPEQTLVALSTAYLHFAIDNRLLWRALFDVELTEESGIPDWYMAELGRLFAFISEPLAKVYPDYGPEDIELMTRALFSSVHGIVILGLENRISGVPSRELERMIELVLTNIAAR